MDTDLNQDPAGQGDVQEPQVTPPAPDAGDAPAEKPWAQYLTNIPETFVPVLEPGLQKLYEDQQAELADLASKYEPFNQVLEGTDPQYLQQALQLAEQIKSDPEQVMKALAAAVGYDIDDNSDDNDYDPDDDEDYDDEDTDPRLLELQDQVKRQNDALTKLSQLELDKATQEQQRRDDEALDGYLADLKAKHGELYDEELVTIYLANGRSGEEAIEYRRSMGVVGRTPPKVLGSGSLPSNQRPITELNRSETTDHVVAMLQAAQAANNS